MKKILISADALDRFDEQSTYIVNMIDYLIRAGYQVELVTWRCSWKVQKALAEYRTAGQLRLTLGEEEPAEASYDAALIFKGFFSAPLIARLEKNELQTHFIFHHFDYSRQSETELDARVENLLASTVFAFTPYAAQRLTDEGIMVDKLQTLPFLLPAVPKHSALRINKPQKVLSLTPKLDKELRVACEQQGLELIWINSNELAVRVTAETVREYDLVMTSGYIATLTLSAGLPVFIADGEHFYDYLGEHNYQDLHHYGFACLPNLPVLTAEQCAYQMKNAWLQAQQWVATQWQAPSVTEAISRLEAVLAQPLKSCPSVSEDALRQLSLHSKICIGNLQDNYNVHKWLQQRSPSSTRESILKSFLSSAAETSRIGVLILDAGEDVAALEQSLASLEEQRLQAHIICVADPTGYFQNLPLAQQINLLVFDNPTCINLLAESGALDWLVVMPAGWKLLPHALLTFAEYHLRAPQTRAFYCDEIFYQNSEQQQVVLRPDCNIDLLRSFPYAGAVLSLDVSTINTVGGTQSNMQQLAHYDLVWKFIEREGMQALASIPDVLVEAPMEFNHWKRQPALFAEAEQNLKHHYQRFSLPATVTGDKDKGIFITHYPVNETDLVSVIIPSKNKAALLKNCIDNLADNTRWRNLEILIVDNGSDEADSQAYLTQLKTLGLSSLRVLDYPGEFNYAAMINLAAAQAQGNYLLLLDNDCEVQQPEWLHTLMGIAQRSEVGAVGPKLCFRDGRVQHGGYLTGIHQGIVNPFEFSSSTDMGYLHYLSATHNVSALSGSCLLTRTALFNELGGLDEASFAVFFADVDYCLKLKENGYVVTWTPNCEVVHMGGATLLLSQEKAAIAMAKEEAQQALMDKWRQKLTLDNRYHPLMAKYGKPFTISEQMARIFPSLPGRPLPRFMAAHSGWYGCGNHRVIQPYKALEENVFTEGGLYMGVPKVLEVAEMQPDTILLQLPSGIGYPDLIKKYRRQCDARIIVEYDDYLPNLPVKNTLKHLFPQHIVKALRRVMAMADSVVVSTQPLAEAYASFHHDIRVAHNRLAVSQWGSLMSQRRTGKKIRVGWAGGGTHAGDLEIIQPVIKALQDEVEWVFMGMKPEGIKCEFHTGVPFDLYPEKLASLNLDLALVPLEINHFNICKSNLRLLEIGACGVPIIATRIEPYQCGLPVTLVDNRFKDWVSAIKMHLADMDATAKMGDALRAAVHQDWMLREHGLDEWRRAWLGE
ncbi:glycosyltransferase [Mixta calida]|uniref:glycosyltransferase n=1 Tax=Mixta calida TaxID=665913 RepID=UPI0016805E9A|nr:glycosyltransferase [Mixta calida]MDU6538834.1 glycosyltransferase [Mixta calida]QNU42125.1 glycosyltransferase [Mixta calida]